MRFPAIWLAVLCTWPALTCQGETNVLDFESLAQPGIGFFNTGILCREDGFVIASINGLNGLAGFRTGDARYSGSTAIFNNTTDDWTSLSKSNAASFDLLSIKLTSLNEPIAQTLTFYGYRASTVVCTHACSTTGETRSQSFTFSGFTNLTEVRWMNNSPVFQFDDIEVSSNAEDGPRERIVPYVFQSVFLFHLVHLRVGKNYTLERSEDLVNWLPLSTNYARAAWRVAGDISKREKSFYRLSFQE